MKWSQRGLEEATRTKYGGGRGGGKKEAPTTLFQTGNRNQPASRAWIVDDYDRKKNAAACECGGAL